MSTGGLCAVTEFIYIGVTATTLSRRLTMHLPSGGPKEHLATVHNTALTRPMLVNQTKIIYRNNEPKRLQIMALFNITTPALITSTPAPNAPLNSTSTLFPAHCLPLLLFTPTVPAPLNNFFPCFSPQLYFLLTRGFFNASFPTLLTLLPTFAQCTNNLLNVSDHVL